MGYFSDKIKAEREEKERLEELTENENQPQVIETTSDNDTDGTSCPTKDTVEYLELEFLIPSKRNTFKPYDGEMLDRLVQSIKQRGIINPLIVRRVPHSPFHEVLSGNNRVNAAKLVGLTELPCRCYNDISDDEADLIALETNFCQRSMEETPHSERAATISKWYDIQKKQGVRTDLINEVLEAEKDLNVGQNETSYPVDTKLNRTDTKLGEKFNLSGITIQRYIRINMLTDDLKERVDNSEIPLRSAVNLSFLTLIQQDFVEQVILENPDIKISVSISENLKESAKKLKTKENVEACIKGEKKDKSSKPEPIKVSLKSKFLKQYLPKNITTQKEAMCFVEEAIKYYIEHNKGDI